MDPKCFNDLSTFVGYLMLNLVCICRKGKKEEKCLMVCLLEFKVYHKINNKNDSIHFYSNHSDKTKSSILIGLFLRALRICSSKYLNKEFEHIHNFFFPNYNIQNFSFTMPNQKP